MDHFKLMCIIITLRVLHIVVWLINIAAMFTYLYICPWYLIVPLLTFHIRILTSRDICILRIWERRAERLLRKMWEK